MNDKKMAADIAEWLKDHQYTCLADSNGVEVWRCQKPGSIHLAFDICITRFGISLFGDIDSLVFRVGASYGFQFLARNPDGYMHEKLDQRYRAEREFDPEHFLWHIVNAICDRISTSVPDEQIPEWSIEGSRGEVTAESLKEWLQEHVELDGGLQFDEMADLIGEAQDIVSTGRDCDTVIAFDFLRDNEELLDVSDTWEWSLDRPTQSLIRRLHYVSHAARQILAIKAANAEQVAS